MLLLWPLMRADVQVADVTAVTKQLLLSMDPTATSENALRKAVRQQTGLPKSKSLKRLVSSLVEDYLHEPAGETRAQRGWGGSLKHNAARRNDSSAVASMLPHRLALFL